MGSTTPFPRVISVAVRAWRVGDYFGFPLPLCRRAAQTGLAGEPERPTCSNQTALLRALVLRAARPPRFASASASLLASTSAYQLPLSCGERTRLHDSLSLGYCSRTRAIPRLVREPYSTCFFLDANALPPSPLFPSASGWSSRISVLSQCLNVWVGSPMPPSRS